MAARGALFEIAVVMDGAASACAGVTTSTATTEAGDGAAPWCQAAKLVTGPVRLMRTSRSVRVTS